MLFNVIVLYYLAIQLYLFHCQQEEFADHSTLLNALKLKLNMYTVTSTFVFNHDEF